MRLSNLIADYLPQIIEMRRYFRTYPELSGQEYNTQRKIMAELEEIGLMPRKAAGTGVVADIVGVGSGPIVSVRADIDALAVQDELEKPYRSQNHGVCHSCGHDGHIAMVLGTARVLNELKQEFNGTIRLIFQPSEERFPGGATAMLTEGVLENVSSIIGGHLWQPIQTGIVGISGGRLMAAPDEFEIILKGKGGHGSMPHQTIDPLLTGAQLVVALNLIVSRNINPMEPAVLSIGVFKAGEAFNVIPDSAVIKGTVRTFDQALRAEIFERIDATTAGLCKAIGVNYKIERRFGFPPLINDPQIAEIIADTAREAFGAERVIAAEPVMVGEDFSVYLKKVPGAFVFIGCGNEAKGLTYPHHHPRFDIDEESLGYGTELYCRCALRLLRENH